MGINDLLGGALGKQIIDGIAGATGQESNKTGNVLSMGLPLLMKAMQRKASSSEGANNLLGALSQNAGGGVLGNLTQFFNGGVDESDKQQGAQLLGDVLGDKQQGVTDMISKQSGMDAGSVMNILSSAGPVLMGFLGQKSQEAGVQEQGQMQGFLGSLLGGNDTEKEQSMLERMLDADGDGQIIDDIAGMFMGGGNNNMLGNILGNIFGGNK